MGDFTMGDFIWLVCVNIIGQLLAGWVLERLLPWIARLWSTPNVKKPESQIRALKVRLDAIKAEIQATNHAPEMNKWIRLLETQLKAMDEMIQSFRQILELEKRVRALDAGIQIRDIQITGLWTVPIAPDSEQTASKEGLRAEAEITSQDAEHEYPDSD